MTPDIVVDVGNSRVKWGRVVPGGIGETASFPHDDAVGWKRKLEGWHSSPSLHWAVSGVHPPQIDRFQAWLSAHHFKSIEITTGLLINAPDRFKMRVVVDEPGRVGVDRLTTALAATNKTPSHLPIAIINVGTAMTVDFVDVRRRFVGGAILPGPRLMARSLHEYTAKLPHVDIDPDPPSLIFGSNTAEAIGLGIASAIVGAADQLLWDWVDQYSGKPKVYITGGDYGYFSGYVFTADTSGVVTDPRLTLDGIRIAAEALP